MTWNKKVTWKLELQKITCIKTVNGVPLHYFEFHYTIKAVNDI